MTLQTAMFPVKKWKSGRAGTFKVPVNFLSALAHGTYQIEISIVASPALTESNTANNLLTVNASGQTLTLAL